jgi:hypothetical protein
VKSRIARRLVDSIPGTYGVPCEQIPVHGDEHADADLLREAHGLAGVHVSNQAHALAVVVASVDGQQSYVDRVPCQGFVKLVGNECVARVIETDAGRRDQVSDKAHEPVLAATLRVAVRHLDTVPGRNHVKCDRR